MLLRATQILHMKVAHVKATVSGKEYDQTRELTTHLRAAALLPAPAAGTTRECIASVVKYDTCKRETRIPSVSMTFPTF